jgi:hypothetical protein
MCMLSYLPPHTPGNFDSLQNGGLNNPDGFGWAIVIPGEKILVGKSMDLNEALDGFLAVRDENLEGPALFHSRYATHGKLNVDNVHPFQCAMPDQFGVWANSPDTVLAHNGILRAAAQPAKGDPRSDTRKFAEDIMMRNFRRLDRPGVKAALTQWVKSDKLVILTVDPRFECSAYIVNQHRGVWERSTGIWHSNHDYLFYVAKGHKWSGSYDWEAWPQQIGKKGMTGTRNRADAALAAKVRDDEDVCRWCTAGHVGVGNFCNFCKSCEECGVHIRNCKCYCISEQELDDIAEFEADLASAKRHLAAQERLEK